MGHSSTDREDEFDVAPAAVTRRRRRSFFGAIFLLVLALALRAWLQWAAPLPGDRLLASLRSDRLPLLVRGIDKAFNELGRPPVAFVTVLCAFLFLLFWVPPRAAVGLLASSGVVIAGMLIKAACGPTPLWLTIAPDAGVDYPSGHTAYATSVFGYLGLVAYQRRQRPLALIALLIVLGMGVERVVSGVHLFSDVVGGYLLGTGWLIIVILMVDSGRPPTLLARQSSKEADVEGQA